MLRTLSLVFSVQQMIPICAQISYYAGMRRNDICLYLSPADRSRLAAIMQDRNSSAKAIWLWYQGNYAADG